VSIRPHLVIGPRDNNLLPRVVERAKQGRLMIVGDGTNKVDLTYVDNAAWAHVDAADALRDERAACAGKAYFVSNDEPVDLWAWANGFLPRVGAPAVTRKIGLGTATVIGGMMELAYRTLPLSGEPRMTRFLAAALARTHWYSMEPAKRDFGYRIRVPMAEATDRTVAWFNQ
jgi:nucleoside-diphosphate-sugar epimerase